MNDLMPIAVTIASSAGAGYLLGTLRCITLKAQCSGLQARLAATNESYERIATSLYQAKRDAADMPDLQQRLVDQEIENGALRTEVAALKSFKDEVLTQRRITASAGGKARAAKQAEARKPAIAKTIADFGSSPMRSRAQVVAPVKAARTRKANQAAGVASSTGGCGRSPLAGRT